MRKFLLLLALLAVPLLAAADWPGFRGPGGQGTAQEGESVPTSWSENENVLWAAPLPGFGASSPVVYDGKIYLTAYSGYGTGEGGSEEDLTRHVLCYDLESGDEVFNFTTAATLPVTGYGGFQALHGYASSTPVTDGEKLYVFFGNTGVGALSLAGEPLWKGETGEGIHGWGSASSPVLYDDLMIINASVENGNLMAFNINNGREVWRAPGVSEAWNSPHLVEVDGHTELVISSKDQILAYDPTNGEELWRSAGIRDYVCPTIVSNDGVIYAIGARSGQAVAVRAGGRGNVTDTHLLWEANQGSNVSSPVYHDGYLYFMHESNGIAFCLNAENGELMYQERVDPRPDLIYASPTLVDGNIYYVTREEGTFVIAAKPQYELVEHIPHMDESVHNGSPAVVDGKLLLRSDRFLYCIGQ